MTASTVAPAALRDAGRSGETQRRRSVMLAVALSVLLHALGFWYLIEHAPLPPTTASRGDDRPLRVTLTPLQAPAVPAVRAPEPPVPAKPAKESVKPPPSKPLRQAVVKPTPATTPRKTITVPRSAQQVPAPADDMLTQLNAARERRADAATQEPALQAETAPAAENDAQRANRIARENIGSANPGVQGADKDDHGGVFQIRRLGLHSAEFMFRGWNVNFRRNSTQLVNVDQGADDDIRIAVVKKMIELIRRYKSGDFIWDSHRLDKQFTLSANPEHGGELQQFLLREFFPDYVANARR